MNEGVFIRCIQDIQSIHVQTTPTSAAPGVMLLLRVRDGAGRRVGLAESRRDTAAMLRGQCVGRHCGGSIWHSSRRLRVARMVLELMSVNIIDVTGFADSVQVGILVFIHAMHVAAGIHVTTLLHIRAFMDTTILVHIRMLVVCEFICTVNLVCWPRWTVVKSAICIGLVGVSVMLFGHFFYRSARPRPVRFHERLYTGITQGCFHGLRRGRKAVGRARCIVFADLGDAAESVVMWLGCWRHCLRQGRCNPRQGWTAHVRALCRWRSEFATCISKSIGTLGRRR